MGFTQQLTATPRDAQGNEILGRTVDWSSAAPTVATVSSGGLVTGIAVAAQPVTVTARVDGRSGTTQVTVQDQPASRLSIVAQPGASTVGSALTPALQIALQRVTGGTVSSETRAVTVALGLNPAGATLTGNLTRAAVNGIATFDNLRVDRPGAYTLVASGGALPSATSGVFQVAATADTSSFRCANWERTFTLTPMTVSSGTQPNYSWTFGRARAVNVFGIDNDDSWALNSFSIAGVASPVQHRLYPVGDPTGYWSLPGSVSPLIPGKRYLVLVVATDAVRASCAVFTP